MILLDYYTKNIAVENLLDCHFGRYFYLTVPITRRQQPLLILDNLFTVGVHGRCYTALRQLLDIYFRLF